MEGKDFNKELVRRYRDNKATEEELELFFHLMNEGRLERELEEVMNEESLQAETTGLIIPLYRRTWFRVATAAIVILIAGVTFLLLNRAPNQHPVISRQPVPVIDVAPGGNKAVLTLADNSTIVLDSAANGTLTQQGETKILKQDGQLAYNSLIEKPTEVLFNTITTPRGGQYQLVLADGSRVWLNAASSLRFPVDFVGKERKVEITGEAYFEVAKNASKPFIVTVAGKGEVEVLGTHFNINSYADEASINTTLLEGSVKVTGVSTQDSHVISPGQQARLNSNGNISINKNPDLDEVMAWKNGQFSFNSLDIESIMRQVSRWYDVDVSFDGKTSKETYSAIVSRNSNISQVLKIMEEGGVNST